MEEPIFHTLLLINQVRIIIRDLGDIQNEELKKRTNLPLSYMYLPVLKNY